MRWSCLSLVLLWGWIFAPIAAGSGPADDLLKLVPTDSGLTLTVEDLRGHAKEITGSPLYDGINRLPPVRAWYASDRFRTIDRASRDIQGALGVSLGTIRDELLGDAVILALLPGPAGKPDQSQGLLLAKPRDRSLFPKLLQAVNDSQIKSGELAGVEPRPRGPLRYMVRQFKAGGRPAEYYVQLEDGSFAWSNSEMMIQGVIDRKVNGGSGLGDEPAFQKVRRGLPERALASLFVNPRMLERLMADSPRPEKPSQDRMAAMLARYVGAVSQMGFALQWRDGLVLHSHEVIATERLDPWIKRWLTRPSTPVTLPSQVPPTAVALLSSNLDFEALRDAAWELTPEDDRPSLDNLKLGLQGILLGLDPSTQVLPRLGPGALLYIEIEPDRAVLPRFPLVGVVNWSDQPGAIDLSGPIDNGLRTALAFYAFDKTRRALHLRVESRTIGDTKLTLLTDGLRALMTYRVDHNRLILGNSPEAVARFAKLPPSSTLTAVRTKYFPEAETFAVVDLERFVGEIKKLRGPIARSLAARSKRPVDATDRDLGQLISLADLFKAATFTSVAEKDATEVHRTIGLIAR